MHRLLAICLIYSYFIASCGSGGSDGTVTPPPPPTSKWSNLAPLADGPRQELGVALLNGEIYAVGGFDEDENEVPDAEVYSPANNTWRRIAALPQPLHHVNVAAAGGKIYVVGALTGSGSARIATGVTLEYDPAANRWTTRRPMPPGTERGASGVAMIGDRIYVAGGRRGVSVDDFSVYDPATDSWQTLQNMPTARDHLAVAAANGVFYAIGGRNSGGLRGEVEFYNPSTSSWSVGRPMPTPRGGCMGAVIGGRIFIVGGEGNPATANGMFAQNEAYDIGLNAWTTEESMRTPRHGTQAVALNGILYVPGGATRQGFGATAVNESFTP